MPTPHDRIAALPDPMRVSDCGKGAAAMYAALDAEYHEARKRRRIEYVMSRLTMKQHELFALMLAGMNREAIMTELNICKNTLSIRENILLRRVRRLLAELTNQPTN